MIGIGLVSANRMMTPHRFITPVFRGGRFERHTLPLEVLGDLEAYRELVVALAGHLLMTRNPERSRLPNGFAESLQIGITGIGAGSTQVFIDRAPTARGAAGDLFPSTDVFEDARDLIERALENARRQEPLPTEIPAHFVQRFNQFGRGLRPDESIELRSANHSSGPIYDRELRRWIVLQKATSYEDVVDLVMTIDGAEHAGAKVVVRAHDLRSTRYEAAAAPEIVIQAFRLAPSAMRVIGVGQFSRDGELIRMLRVDAIASPEDEPASRTSLQEQFAEIATLAAGWYDGKGLEFERTALNEFEAFIADTIRRFSLPLPYVYPSPEGEVRVEWPLGEWDVTVRAELSSRSLTVHAVGSGEDADEDFESMWTASDASERVAALVNAHAVRS